MNNAYLAKAAAKKRARTRSAFQSALGVALMVAIGSIGSYLAYVFYANSCGC
jgi:hypothetical protein